MKDEHDKPGKSHSSPSRLSAEDHKLWDFVTRGITPFFQRPAPEKPPLTPKKPLKEIKDPHLPLPTDLFIPPPGLAQPNRDDLSTDRGGIDRRTAERLRKGQMQIEAVLDLHGLRQVEAQDQLIRFITTHHQSGRRCVLVITGKGGRFGNDGGEAGILKRMLPVWLNAAQLKEKILRFTPAQPKDGGSGAFYVLLRRIR